MPIDVGTALLTIAAFVGAQVVITGLAEWRAGQEAERQKTVRAEQRRVEDERAAADRRRALGEREIDEARRALLPALEYYAMRAAGSTQADALEEVRQRIPKNSELVHWDGDTVGDVALVLDVLEAIDRYSAMEPTTDGPTAAAILRSHAELRRRVVQALREQERRLADGLPLERRPATVQDAQRALAMEARPIRLHPDEGIADETPR